MRLIDADMASVYLNKEGWKQIKKMPTVDAVPVIRCKDCRYYEQTEDDDPYCHYLGFYQREGWNWFCAGAERKEE